MESVWKVDDVSLTSDVDDVTLFWLEVHHPNLLSFSKGVQILLEQLGITFYFVCQVDHGIVSKEPVIDVRPSAISLM